MKKSNESQNSLATGFIYQVVVNWGESVASKQAKECLAQKMSTGMRYVNLLARHHVL